MESHQRLTRDIMIAVIGGLALGLWARWLGITELRIWIDFVAPLFELSGRVFLRLLNMIVIPLVITSLLLGVLSAGEKTRLGKLGLRTLAFYLTTTAIAVTIGLALASAVKPGRFLSETSRTALVEQVGQAQQSVERTRAVDYVLDLIPANPIAAAAEGRILPLIIFVIIIGLALREVASERRSLVATAAAAIQDAVTRVVQWIMLLAPYAVAAMLALLASQFGSDVLGSLAVYSGVVVLGLLVHMAITYSTALRVFTAWRPLTFFRRARTAQIVAFSTSSSSATLPVSMTVAREDLNISAPVSSFVLPLGSTVNMDGTALYQGVATLFIAQVFGSDLSFAQLVTVVLTATLASIGAAGVPGAGIVTLFLVLQSVGLHAEAAVGVALVLAVDRPLDMFRTAVNVTGDLTCAAVVEQQEEKAVSVAALTSPIPELSIL